MHKNRLWKIINYGGIILSSVGASVIVLTSCGTSHIHFDIEKFKVGSSVIVCANSGDDLIYFVAARSMNAYIATVNPTDDYRYMWINSHNIGSVEIEIQYTLTLIDRVNIKFAFIKISVIN